MDWIKMSDRFPDNWEDKIIKTDGGGVITNSDFSNQHNCLMGPHGWYQHDELFWLDESSPLISDKELIEFAEEIGREHFKRYENGVWYFDEFKDRPQYTTAELLKEFRLGYSNKPKEG